jgi:hypothetical protein
LLSVAVGGSACTVTVTSGDGGNPFDDGGGQDTATAADTATNVDSGTQPDTAAAPDTGSQAETGATADGSDGGSCAILRTVSFGSATCDMCIGTSCCDVTTVCFTGAENDCADKASCFGDCLVGNPDAGIAPGDPTTCMMQCAGPDSMVSTFETWVACVSNNCSTPCQ